MVVADGIAPSPSRPSGSLSGWRPTSLSESTPHERAGPFENKLDGNPDVLGALRACDGSGGAGWDPAGADVLSE